MGCSRAEKVIITYGFLGDDGEVAGVDALVAELPRRVPLRATRVVLTYGGGELVIDRTSGCRERIESNRIHPQRGEGWGGLGTDRRDAAAEDDVLEVPGLRRHVNT